MFSSLMPDLLSIKADLPRTVALAKRHGFGGVDTSAGNLLAPDLDPARLVDAMAESGIRPGYIGLPPGRTPASDADWQSALALLPQAAARAQQIGFARAALVVLPFHETLPFEAAFAEHIERLSAVTTILDDYGIALALEYVSPLSRRAAYDHHFVYEMRGMLALCDALPSPRVGLLLDSFHWHCAGENAVDIARLPKERIVVVHINDAPDRPNDEQTVGERTLPGATGVIDLPGFVGALRTAGYDGPVTCEPMAKAIAELSANNDDDIVSLTAAALRETLSAKKGDTRKEQGR